MSREVCEHFVLIGRHCQDCEDAGREARLSVQRGEVECSICGDTAREQDGGPVNPLQATIDLVHEAVHDDDLNDRACRLAISILVQEPIKLTDKELTWATGVANSVLADEEETESDK